MRDAVEDRPAAAARSGTAALACLLLLGCSEAVRPVLGGLKIGGASTSFQMPVMENERPPFDYPRAAWRDRIGGETVLKIHIAADGAVDSVHVHRSSGHRGLDSAAVAGARRLRYRPALQEGEPVGVWATLPVHYPMPSTTGGRP